MKKQKYYLLALMAAALTFGACSDSDSDPTPDPNPDPIPGVVNGEMTDMALRGYVYDTDGEPIVGVHVVSGTSVCVTDAAGMFAMSTVDFVEKRPVVKFTCDGYFDIVRSLAGSDDAVWEIVMCEKDDDDMSSTTNYRSTEAQTLTAGGMRVDMPADGYMTDATGKPYSGVVKAEMVYLDPNEEHFAEMMPGGDLSAVRTDGSDAILVSYGMTAVNLTDGQGNKLQLKEGSRATLTFPVPEGMDNNLPATIPLWSFNESTGLWEEEGVATLQGNVYVGEVSHFSWVNLDQPEDRAVINGYVRNQAGMPLGGIRLTLGQLSGAVTDATGYYEAEVQANTEFELVVKSSHYGNYRSVYARPISPIEPGETKTVSVMLPTLRTVAGRVVNNGGGSNIASIWIAYGSNQTKAVTSEADGNFSLYAPEGYNGTATLNVLAVDGERVTVTIELASGNINVGDIYISSSASTGGEVQIRLSDGSTVNMTIPSPGENEMAGVIQIDDKFIFTNESEDESKTMLNIQVDGFSDSKTSYTDGTVAVSDPSGRMLYNEGSTNVNINKKDNRYVVGFSGSGIYYNQSDGTYDSNASFNSTDITMDVVMKGTSMRNVVPSDEGFPSFMPELSRPAVVAVRLTQGKMFESGATAFYNGTLSDFNTLVAAAEKSGVKKVYAESESDYGEAMFFSGSRCIMIDFDATVDDIDGTEEDVISLEAQITVTALTGVDEDFIYAMGKSSGDIFEAVRAAVRKQR